MERKNHERERCLLRGIVKERQKRKRKKDDDVNREEYVFVIGVRE